MILKKIISGIFDQRRKKVKQGVSVQIWVFLTNAAKNTNKEFLSLKPTI